MSYNSSNSPRSRGTIIPNLNGRNKNTERLSNLSKVIQPVIAWNQNLNPGCLTEGTIFRIIAIKMVYWLSSIGGQLDLKLQLQRTFILDAEASMSGKNFLHSNLPENIFQGFSTLETNITSSQFSLALRQNFFSFDQQVKH